MTQGMKRGNSTSDEGGNIWDVVTSLVHALSDARDQLVGIIKHDRNTREIQHGHGVESTQHDVAEEIAIDADDTVALRGGGGFRRACCTGRGYGGGGGRGAGAGGRGPGRIGGPRYGINYVPNNRKIRSVHHKHARGHVAFGSHSEFKPEPPKRRCKPVTAAATYSPPRKSRCGGGGLSIRFVPNVSLPPPKYACQGDRGNSRSPCQRDRGNSRSPCQRDRGNSGSPCTSHPYECRRHCIGNQYVAVLREEACRIRERRLEKECEIACCSKPRWARC